MGRRRFATCRLQALPAISLDCESKAAPNPRPKQLFHLAHTHTHQNRRSNKACLLRLHLVPPPLSTPYLQALSPARSSFLPLFPSPPPHGTFFLFFLGSHSFCFLQFCGFLVSRGFVLDEFVHSEIYIFFVLENDRVFLCASKSQWLVNLKEVQHI